MISRTLYTSARRVSFVGCRDPSAIQHFANWQSSQHFRGRGIALRIFCRTTIFLISFQPQKRRRNSVTYITSFAFRLHTVLLNLKPGNSTSRVRVCTLAVLPTRTLRSYIQDHVKFDEHLELRLPSASHRRQIIDSSFSTDFPPPYSCYYPHNGRVLSRYQTCRP
ncbi:hypothetical protein B0H12DRAFT_336161 [Mycena haematopus]|nr:hypothetical protein B0H12DRAFT_336161 [Mycena haematopus]